MKLVFDRVQQAPAPFFVKPVVKNLVGRVNDAFLMPNIKRQLAFIESELAQRTWFAGDEFTAADIQMSYPVEAAAARIGLDASYPNIKAWLAGIHARPAYIKALEAGGPYAVVP
jgi:glutathione S-transferase